MEPTTQKRLVGSLTYPALVAVVAALGYLTLRLAHRETVPDEPLPADLGALVEVQNFRARRVETEAGRQIQISVQIRTSANWSIPVQVFFVAKPNSPGAKHYGVWPTLGADGVVTAGGHVRGGRSSSAAETTLTQSWTRLTGIIPEPTSLPRYESVIVYVVGPRGEVLLSRPFSLPLE